MASEAAYPTILAAPGHYRRGRIARVDTIGVHCTATAESAAGTGAEAVARHFANPASRDASATVTVDNNSTVRSVHDYDTPYAAKGANARGVHLELVGLAQQSRAQWLDPVSKATLRRGAAVCADWIRRSNGLIAPRWLSVAEIHAGKGGGLATHADIERALPSSGHWDPGPHFPRDVFLQLVKSALAVAPPHKPGTNPYAQYAGPIRQSAVQQGGRARWVQWALGFSPIDGFYRTEETAAIRALQNKWHQPVTGEVGDDHDWTNHYLRSVTR
jgi:hypothetical protein